MTRVSDALARAATDPQTAAQPASLEQPAVADIDAWPVERPEPPSAASELDVHVRVPEAEVPFEPTVHTDVGQEKLVTSSTTEPASVEQYRRLATRLHLSQAEHGTKVVMITSAVPSEGKTLTASNLALTLSESYRRHVLLIDADLRRPWLHELFQLPNVTGLNDGIRSAQDRKVPLIRVSEYLSVLTAGRPDPDPMSVLASDRMRRVLGDAAKAFDWVIVDTPPVAVLSDAHLLANLVDTVVLVVKAGTTQCPAMKQAIDAVGRDRILGVVLNCAATGRQGAYNYYRYARQARTMSAL